MKSVFVSVALAAAVSAVSCGGDDAEPNASDDNGERLIAYIPLVEGAVEIERRVEVDSVYVVYETDASLRDAVAFYDAKMSMAPWRVTTYELNEELGSANLVFRNEDEKIIASARLASANGKTTINLDVLPIPDRGSLSEAPAATIAPSAGASQ